MAKAKVGNVMNILSGVAQKAPSKKKKDELPILDLALTSENLQALKDWIDQKRKERAAESLKKKAEAKLLPQVIEARHDHCMKDKFHKSVKVKVGDSESITCSFQSKYSAISTTDQDKLQEIFKDKYDQSFRLRTNVSLSEKTMEEVQECAKEGKPGPLDKIIAVIGAEKFAELFVVTQSLEPTAFLDEKRVTDREISQMASMAIEAEILKPQKPSFSLA